MKREEKRNRLKTNIFNAAFNRIEQNGLVDLRARDIAQDAACSLGSLYNAYQDLDDIILDVNGQILSKLSDFIRTNINSGLNPEDVLTQYAQNYFNFACDNYNLWSSLFSHTMQEGAPIPEWYKEQTNAMFLTLVTPVITLRPDLDEGEAFILVRMLFSAVHGIIVINLQERFITIPRDMLQIQLNNFVKTYTNGLKAETKIAH